MSRGYHAAISSPGLAAYAWSPTTGLSAAGISNPVFRGSASTVYLLRATDLNGCTATDIVSITVFDPPLADFSYTPDVPSSFVPTIDFADRSKGAVTWLWTFGDSVTSFLQNPSHAYSLPDIYTVTLEVSSPEGCINQISKPIEYKEEYSIWLPNSFTPNNDGINDVFFAEGFNVSFEELAVFNRNGEMIFSGNRLDEGWDGSYQYHDAQEGLYVCLLRYRTPAKKVITEAHYFSLIR